MQPDDSTPTPHEQTSSEGQAATPPAAGETAQQPWTPQVITPASSSIPHESAAADTAAPNQPVPTDAETTAPGATPPTTPVAGATPSVPPAAGPVSDTPAPTSSPAVPASGGGAGTTPPAGGTPKRSKRKLLLAAIVVAILILAGAYVFAFYLPNTPGNVYKSGLSRTGAGYDKLVSYISQEQARHYKGFSADGTFKLTSPDSSGDGTFTAQSDGANSTGQLNLDLSGEKFSANFRSVEPKGQDEPDIYFQVNGIKSFLDSFGLSSMDNLDGQWIAVDHTLLETALASQNGDKSSQKASAPTYAQVQDALQKISPVNKKYLFATGKNAVLVNQKYLGESTQDGRSVDGYQVGYNKANLKAYVNALGTALDSSSLGAWVKQTTGKTITDELNMSELQKSIDQAKSNYTFDLYIDTKTKLIHKVHFPEPSSPADNFVEASLNYTGGDKYPFVFSGTTKDGGDTSTVKIALTLDMSTNQINFDTTVTEKGSGTTNLSETATIKPSNQSVTVTAPANAEPIMNVLGNLGLGDLFDGSSQLSSGDSANTDPFTLTE